MDLIDYITNLELSELIKFVVAFLGFIALVLKIGESFSSYRIKQNLKIDLEIYNQAKRNNELDVSHMEKQIQFKVNSTYNKSNSSKFTNFILGVIVFIGFGWWSIDIVEIDNKFNPWVMLTMFISCIGLTLIFDDGRKTKSKSTFFQIEFTDKDNFKVGCLFSVATLCSIGILLSYRFINAWLILPVVFFLVFAFSLINNIKFKSIELDNDEETK